MVSYDGQLATCGITTVLDSLRVWREEGAEDVDGQARGRWPTRSRRRARDDLLRADHFLHLRCEIPMPTVVADTAELLGRADVRLLSLMDHTPGQRQFRDEQKLRTYYRGKAGGLDRRRARRPVRASGSACTGDLCGASSARAGRRSPGRTACRSPATTTRRASMSRRRSSDGVAIAEFPTTLEAAEALHGAGVKVLMGAPNLVRGGSHSGNVATAELARAGMLDALSSDYVPASLLMAALRLPAAAPTSICRRRCAPSPRRRPRRSGSTIAARSRPASAPT